MYEIHLTTAPLAGSQWAGFARFAAAIEAKPMVIALARGRHPVQPMLSLCRAGTIDQAIAFAQALAVQAAQAGFAVVRCKIEQDASPDTRPVAGERHHYYEWHARMAVPEPIRLRLAALCAPFGGHLSNNAIRGGDIRYVTLRETGEHAGLRSRVDELRGALDAHGWTIEKQQWERVVFDSNLALDKGWLEQA
ncbi:hypothetical protein F2P45_11125 [Massilia sp. CCM 8733]|uniref:Uncharacterized protein n=1 Tax=Massilia mucilaginosa TaxID=2609282 RepID=A0ABX0NSJ5_9BURK|nr:hypothetical protein [Massilia mucilaginosa]NHZ89562.1 hypothetical protein [Massilia mucilaginosa]